MKTKLETIVIEEAKDPNFQEEQYLTIFYSGSGPKMPDLSHVPMVGASTFESRPDPRGPTAYTAPSSTELDIALENLNSYKAPSNPGITMPKPLGNSYGGPSNPGILEGIGSAGSGFEASPGNLRQDLGSGLQERYDFSGHDDTKPHINYDLKHADRDFSIKALDKAHTIELPDFSGLGKKKW